MKDKPFSAKVLEVRYLLMFCAFLPSASTSLRDFSFQSFSLKVVGWSGGAMTVPHDEVTTILLTRDLLAVFGHGHGHAHMFITYPFFSAVSNIPTVPLTAGIIYSEK